MGELTRVFVMQATVAVVLGYLVRARVAVVGPLLVGLIVAYVAETETNPAFDWGVAAWISYAFGLGLGVCALPLVLVGRWLRGQAGSRKRRDASD